MSSSVVRRVAQGGGGGTAPLMLRAAYEHPICEGRAPLNVGFTCGCVVGVLLALGAIWVVEPVHGGTAVAVPAIRDQTCGSRRRRRHRADDDDDDDVGCSFAGNTQFSHDIIDASICAVAQTTLVKERYSHVVSKHTAKVWQAGGGGGGLCCVCMCVCVCACVCVGH